MSFCAHQSLPFPCLFVECMMPYRKQCSVLCLFIQLSRTICQICCIFWAAASELVQLDPNCPEKEREIGDDIRPTSRRIIFCCSKKYFSRLDWLEDEKCTWIMDFTCFQNWLEYLNWIKLMRLMRNPGDLWIFKVKTWEEVQVNYGEPLREKCLHLITAHWILRF